MSQELKAQAEQRGEVVGEIVGEFRDAGGWTPKIRWQCSGDHPGVGTKLYTAPPASVVPDDAKLLNAVMENCWKVEPVGVPTGGDDYTVIWRVVEFHMPEREVEIARTDSDDPREAIRAAMLAAAPEVAAKGAQS